MTRPFPVIEDHPALSDRGAAADAARFFDDEPDQTATPAVEVAGRLLFKLHELTTIHPAAPCIVLLRLFHPSLSLRQIGRNVHLSKSMVHKITTAVDTHHGDISRILAGYSWKSKAGQRTRWTISRQEKEINKP